MKLADHALSRPREKRRRGMRDTHGERKRDIVLERKRERGDQDLSGEEISSTRSNGWFETRHSRMGERYRLESHASQKTKRG